MNGPSVECANPTCKSRRQASDLLCAPCRSLLRRLETEYQRPITYRMLGLLSEGRTFYTLEATATYLKVSVATIRSRCVESSIPIRKRKDNLREYIEEIATQYIPRLVESFNNQAANGNQVEVRRPRAKATPNSRTTAPQTPSRQTGVWCTVTEATELSGMSAEMLLTCARDQRLFSTALTGGRRYYNKKELQTFVRLALGGVVSVSPELQQTLRSEAA